MNGRRNPPTPSEGTNPDTGARETDESSNHGALQREIYFPTFIYYRDIVNGERLNARLLSAIRASQADDATGIERSNIRDLGGWHSHTDLQEGPEFEDLARAVVDTAAEISADLGYDPDWRLVIDNMWTIVNPPGSYNRGHNHPGCLWSGVYYVQVPEKAGRISFTDSRHAHLMLHPRFIPGQQRSKENWTEVFFDPKPGRMILFPSWLQHAVEANLSEQEGEAGDRIAISFNLYQSRSTSI